LLNYEVEELAQVDGYDEMTDEQKKDMYAEFNQYHRDENSELLDDEDEELAQVDGYDEMTDEQKKDMYTEFNQCHWDENSELLDDEYEELAQVEWDDENKSSAQEDEADQWDGLTEEAWRRNFYEEIMAREPVSSQ
jgi:hypothetical protein